MAVNGKRKRDPSLFEQMSEGALKLVVDSWLRRYADDRDTASAELIKFIFQACVPNLSQVDIDVHEQDHEDVISEIQSCFESGETSPINEEVKGKGFRSRYTEFWYKLVQKTQESVLYSDQMIPELLEWLSHIASADLRPLRLAATIATYQVMKALVKVVTTHQKDLVTARTALEKENKKKKKQKKIVQQFEDDVKDLGEKIPIIHSLMATAFNNVFVHRFRDVSEEIRKLSIDSLGNWMKDYPAAFLVDKKLAYIGWCLNDKDASVRRVGLAVLQSLYKNPDCIERLASFLERFISRILQMTNDTNENVSVDAITLLTKLLSHGLLEQNDGSNIASFMWDKNARIREVAAKFVKRDSFYVEEGDEDEDKVNSDLYEIINIYETSSSAEPEEEKDISAEYLVDSLWSKLPCLRDWSVITAMLLDSEKPRRRSVAPQDDRLSEKQSTSLAFILLACARKDRGKMKAVDLRKGNSAASKNRERDEDDSSDFTACFVTQLPKLLKAFQTDEVKLTAFVQMVLYLDIEEFPLRRKKQALKDLLKVLKTIFLKSSSSKLCGLVVESFSYMCSKQYDWQEDARQTVFEIVSELKHNFTAIAQDSSPENVAFLCLNRMVSLITRMSFIDPQFTFEFDVDLILKESRSFPESTKLSSLLFRLSMGDVARLMFRLNQLSSESDENDVSGITAKLVKRRDSFLQNLLSSLKSGNQTLQMNAFLGICDLVCFSKSSILQKASDILPLEIDEDEDGALDLLGKFVNSVFEEDFGDISENKESDVDAIRRDVVLNASKLTFTNPSLFHEIGSTIISQYSRFDSNLNGIVKFFVSEMKRIGLAVLEKMELDAVKQRFVSDIEGQEYIQLSRQLAVLHNFDKASHIDFVKNGILFVMDEVSERAAFLEALLPWIKKFTLQQKQAIFGFFMESKQHQSEDSEEECWDIIHGFEAELRKLSGAVSLRKAAKSSAAAASDANGGDLESRMEDDDGNSDEDDDEPQSSASSAYAAPLRRSNRRKRPKKPTKDADGWVNVRSKRQKK
uniref:Sister-chromatid cohesion protein 3 n=1 Tax=Hirondellea gigas TaxID=1518452 RepID=A0A6A7G440_9CRUS